MSYFNDKVLWNVILKISDWINKTKTYGGPRRSWEQCMLYLREADSAEAGWGPVSVFFNHSNEPFGSIKQILFSLPEWLQTLQVQCVWKVTSVLEEAIFSWPLYVLKKHFIEKKFNS
jgi:hypothetical protein